MLNDAAAKESLATLIRRFVNLSQTEFDTIGSYFTLADYPQGAVISPQGSIISHYYFVAAGCVKLVNETAAQTHSCWFAPKGEFFTELVSLKTGQPSRYAILAADKTQLLTICMAHMEILYARFPKWQQFGRLLWESAFVRMEQRLFSFQTETAMERYLTNLNNGMVQQVPLKDISSYIGVTPNSLSRIRKNVK